MDSTVPNITFDEEGVCNFCHQHDRWNQEYPTDGKNLQDMMDEIKQSGIGNRYDCLVGISGGLDSSYLIYLAKKVWDLRPLAFHFDNGWNSDISKNNMRRMIDSLGVDSYFLKVASEEFDDFCASFLKASVPDADIPNDIGMTAAYYYACEKFGVKNFLIGHSFRTEGSIPPGWTYMDGKYIESVVHELGSREINTFPNLWINDWLRWLEMGIKVLRPYWYMDYNPDDARKFLIDKYGWEWYKTKHGENKYTKFIGYYYLPKKFGIDKRLVRLSAPVRSGFLLRKEALKDISQPAVVEESIISEVKDRLHISDRDFEKIMKAPKKTHLDYETYAEEFKQRQPFFKLLLDRGSIPITFYKKYVE